jgi:hypothetical protein
MKEVFIIGGGISGLMCANVLSEYNVNITVYEPNEAGGEFLTGGLRYIHQTKNMESFLDKNNIAWGDYKINGGILLRNKVYPYPKFLKSLDKSDALRIQNDHYRKTRKIEPGNFGLSAMNDPANSKSRHALRCDLEQLVNVLKNKCNIQPYKLIKIVSDKAYFDNGVVKRFDYIILTIPLWIIKRIVDFEIPLSVAMNLNIVTVDVVRDIYAKWDYVYTPYTPSDSVHRISSEGDIYFVEISGTLDENDLHSDLNFIFKDGWCIKGYRKNLRGHLLPMEEEINIPDNMALLGRYACWEPRATVDVTLDKAIELGVKWFDKV